MRYLQFDFLDGNASGVLGRRLCPYGAELFMFFPVCLLACLDDNV